MDESFEYNQDYVITHKLNEHYLYYADDGFGELRVGDVIEFHPDYYAGGPWSFDNPVRVDVRVKGNMVESVEYAEPKVIGSIRPFSMSLVFTSTFAINKAWRILLPKQAKAFFSGVPIEDVLGEEPPTKRVVPPSGNQSRCQLPIL